MDADWWYAVRDRRAHAVPPHTSVLWTLRKGHHEARAELCIIDGIGDELRFLWNGEMRMTRLFRIGEGGRLLDASEEKRRELEARGWRSSTRGGHG
jgi:hypothetical protein